MGRWLQIDPDGYEAGDSNLYRFVTDAPLIATDPSGLEGLWFFRQIGIKIHSSLEGSGSKHVLTGDRGAFFWPVIFTLTQRSNRVKGGWIIQEIIAEPGIKKGSYIAPKFQDPADRKKEKVKKEHYWEAFRVDPGEIEPESHVLGDDYVDQLKKRRPHNLPQDPDTLYGRILDDQRSQRDVRPHDYPRKSLLHRLS